MLHSQDLREHDEQSSSVGDVLCSSWAEVGCLHFISNTLPAPSRSDCIPVISTPPSLHQQTLTQLPIPSMQGDLEDLEQGSEATTFASHQGPSTTSSRSRAQPDTNTMNWEAPELTKDRRGAQKYGIDLEKNRYPYALVWSPLPLISWIIPFIGHMGICDSRGVIYDFAGPYMIGVDDMAFGRPTKYLLLNPSKIGRKDKPAQEVWDSCVDHGCSVYSRRMHNIWCVNRECSVGALRQCAALSSLSSLPCTPIPTCLPLAVVIIATPMWPDV